MNEIINSAMVDVSARPLDLAADRECWISEEMANALDAGCFFEADDPELLALC